MSTKKETTKPVVPKLPPWTLYDQAIVMDYLEHMSMAAQSAVFSMKRVPKKARTDYVNKTIDYWEHVVKGFRWAQGQAMRRVVDTNFPDVRNALGVSIKPNEQIQVHNPAPEYDPSLELE